MNILWLSANRPVRWIVFFANIPKFCGDEEFLAPSPDSFANQFFVVADAVHVCGVDKIDTKLQSPENRSGGLFIIPRAIKFTHTHATESHAGYNCALRTEIYFIHIFILIIFCERLKQAIKIIGAMMMKVIVALD